MSKRDMHNHWQNNLYLRQFAHSFFDHFVFSPWAQFGRGHEGRVPPFFQTGRYNMPCPHFFLFRFCIWRGIKNKSDVCNVFCEEFFMLDGGLHIGKLMLKQSLLWYH